MEDLESLTVKMMLFISFVNYFVCVFPSPTKNQNETKQKEKSPQNCALSGSENLPEKPQPEFDPGDKT